MNRRALLVTPGYTVIDGFPEDPHAAVKATPADTWARGLGSLLDRVAKTMSGEGVLLLDQAAAQALKLPTGPDDSTTVGLDDARAAGWMAGKVHAWTPFYGEGRPRIIVGQTGWPNFDRSPLVNPKASIDTVYRAAMWQELTGVAWQGTPGVAGNQLLRATAPKWKVRGSDVGPSYGYKTGPEGASELDWQPEDWSRPQDRRWAHCYDMTRMYLAAAQCCEHLAPWALRHSRSIEFSPKLAGWWLVKMGPWAHDRMPAPAGPGGWDEPRWVTTPTLVLLTQLMEAGEEFQTFEVLDSYTGAAKRVLRGWAERLEGAYQGARVVAEDHPDDDAGRDDDARAVMKAVKAAYREAIGMWNHTDDDGRPSATYRPDWHHAVIAQARANMWRTLWKVGREEGRWPLEIKTDGVWFESDDQDQEKARPSGLKVVNRSGLTDALGTWKYEKTREKTDV